MSTTYTKRQTDQSLDDCDDCWAIYREMTEDGEITVEQVALAVTEGIANTVVAALIAADTVAVAPPVSHDEDDWDWYDDDDDDDDEDEDYDDDEWFRDDD